MMPWPSRLGVGYPRFASKERRERRESRRESERGRANDDVERRRLWPMAFEHFIHDPVLSQLAVKGLRAVRVPILLLSLLCCCRCGGAFFCCRCRGELLLLFLSLRGHVFFYCRFGGSFCCCRLQARVFVWCRPSGAFCFLLAVVCAGA